MSRNAWIGVAAGVAAIGGALLLWDALVETDEERVERLVDDVTGTLSPDRVASGRARWIDLSRQPFEISAMGRSLLYREGEDDALSERANEALRARWGERLRALSSGARVEGERATVSMRVMGDRSGMAQLEWRLRKHGDDWLLERLAVTR